MEGKRGAIRPRLALGPWPRPRIEARSACTWRSCQAVQMQGQMSIVTQAPPLATKCKLESERRKVNILEDKKKIKRSWFSLSIPEIAGTRDRLETETHSLFLPQFLFFLLFSTISFSTSPPLSSPFFSFLLVPGPTGLAVFDTLLPSWS